MTHQFDVLVLGGGIVGLTAALAMAQRGYTVAILDAGSLQANTTVPDVRVYAINKASQTLLQKLGVWQHLETRRLAPYSKMYVWDAVNGASIEFDSRSIAAQNLGTILEESHLKQALLQHVSLESNISLFAHCEVDKVETLEQGITICSQNKTWNGQLLMIADGANSPTRQKMDVGLTSWPYKQQALVATVTTEKPHLNTAYQVFNTDGPLAFLPLANAHQCSIVWSTDLERVKNLMTLNEQEFNLELTQAFAKHLGQVTLASTRYQFPLNMRHVQQYTGNRWLLLGDAAHTIHPLAGLGLNVGLADVASWVKNLDQVKGVLFSNKRLGAYQRERKNAVWQTIWLMEGFKQIFSYSLAPIVSIRGLGIRACNQLTPLKRLFILHAAG